LELVSSAQQIKGPPPGAAMNSRAADAEARRAAEVAAIGGLAAYRAHALARLRLKTVVREAHQSPVHALAFNHADAALAFALASAGGEDATAYDDEHLGGHLGVVVHFKNGATPHAPGGGLRAAAWMAAAGWSAHPREAYLAAAGADANVSIISLAEAAVVRLLRGHGAEVLDLAAAPAAAPALLLSLDRGGGARLWDAAGAACLGEVAERGATAAALAPDASHFVLAAGRGRLVRYDLLNSQGEGGGGDPTQPCGGGAAGFSIDAASRRELAFPDGAAPAEALECVRFLPGGRLAARAADGRCAVWALPPAGAPAGAPLEPRAAWRVPGCAGGAAAGARCQFGATADGAYLAMGNHSGEVFVYDAATGARAAAVSAAKVGGPVRAAALSDDCRHLLAAVGAGFVFRFEYAGGAAPAGGEGGKGGGGDADAEAAE
jgi:hypothetical protein